MDELPGPGEILEFWFGSAAGELPPPSVRKRWWVRDPAFDEEIRARFGTVHDAACRGAVDAWAATPRGAVALIIVLDQFSRNLYRASPRAWAQDERGRALTHQVLSRDDEDELGTFEWVFVVMPLMHAEDPEAQRQCVKCFEQRVARTDSLSEREVLATHLDFARRHQAIIDRFGRFPHRNAVLGRASTDEELEFLQQPGSSF